jgi:hypothetical protein
MSHPSELDPEGAVREMWKLAPEYAQAKANRIFLEEYTKVHLAILMKRHADLPVNAQEREARADPEFKTHLEGLKAAVEEEEKMRWQLVSTQTAIDVWRSRNASNRNIDRATQ